MNHDVYRSMNVSSNQMMGLLNYSEFFSLENSISRTNYSGWMFMASIISVGALAVIERIPNPI